ncbi:MAG: thioredoxin fold domain-containing protein [Leptospirales bacterium]|jgi:thioredoxin-related protein
MYDLRFTEMIQAGDRPSRCLAARLPAALRALPAIALIALLTVPAAASLRFGDADGFPAIGGALHAQDNSYWPGDYEAALKKARAGKRLVIVDIYAPWCGYCRKLQNEVYPSKEVRAVTDQFVRVRIDGEKHPELMRKYGVRGFPTIILLDSNGKEIDRIGGYMPARPFARKLRDVQRKGDRENDLLKELKGDPRNVLLNFRAGVYYYESGDARRARGYFLRSFRGETDAGQPPGIATPDKRRDALYNAAIASMDLKDHAGALKYWNLYLKNYPKLDRDHFYARYYRGQTNYELGRKIQARADFAFASRNLPDSRDRADAERYLARLN